MKCVELVGKSMCVLRPLSDVKGDNSQWNYVQAHKFARKYIVLIRCVSYGEKLCHMTYVAGGKQYVMYVPSNHEFSLVTGLRAKLAMKTFDKYITKDLHTLLHHSFMVGSDPEIFVEDGKNNLLPAFEFLGSKTTTEVRTPEEQCKVYWDGFQAEFETGARNCLAYHTDSVQRGLRTLINAARKKCPTAKLSGKTVMQISEEMLQSAAPEHVEFGCMPSFNVYGMEGVKLPGREVNIRSAGGHIHFGIGKKTPEQISKIVKALDAILGVACVSLFAKYDDPNRRVMYGLAGEYRLPPHGLEYRTLSNAWTFHPMIMNLVFDVARKVLVLGERGYLGQVWKGSEKETIETINTCDVAKAREILQRNKDTFIQIIRAAYPYNKAHEEVFNIFMNGMESAVADPTEIEKNWNLDTTWVTHGHGGGKNWETAIQQIKLGKKVA
jgi:hypothetical protein